MQTPSNEKGPDFGPGPAIKEVNGADNVALSPENYFVLFIVRLGTGEWRNVVIKILYLLTTKPSKG
jgi:hypothetical protein